MPQLKDYEDRVGVMPVAELNAHRLTLTEAVAELRAIYGPFGSRDVMRKIELARIKTLVRAQYQAAGTKVTNDVADDEAHAHPDYITFVTKQIHEAADYFRKEARLESLEALDRRSNTMTYYARTEALQG